MNTIRCNRRNRLIVDETTNSTYCVGGGGIFECIRGTDSVEDLINSIIKGYINKKIIEIIARL